ncbi:MAG: GAF domain-containing protein [Deltaproteobacteria bacterium]|nr:GAF domain-containing protein [Deltaproteobacteria bacterium]
MGLYSVTTRSHSDIEVSGENWLIALGRGLERWGVSRGLERLVCETLPNGTVIANDVAAGRRYVVQPMAVEPELPEVEPLPDEPFEGVSSAAEAWAVALQSAQAILPAESGAVLLLEGEYLRFVAASGPSRDELQGVRIPRETGVAGLCLRTRRAVSVPDAQCDQRHFGRVDALTGYRTRDLICVVVGSGEVVLGVLEVMNTPPGFEASRAHLQALRQVGRQLGERLVALGAAG